MLDLFFGSVEDNAEREYATYKPGKGRKKDLGDHLGDFLTGRGDAIDRAVEEQHVERLQRTYGTTLAELNAQPNVSISPLTKDTDSKVLDQQIAIAGKKAQAYKDMKTQAAGHGIIIDPSKITDADSGYAYIKNEIDREKTEKEEKEKRDKKSDLRENREYLEGIRDKDNKRADNLLERANLRADKKEERQILREDRKDERARLDRLETQKMNMQLRGDEMKFKYASLAQQDRQSRQDKKDRAMMTLIQGLGNLGAAFTV